MTCKKWETLGASGGQVEYDKDWFPRKCRRLGNMREIGQLTLGILNKLNKNKGGLELLIKSRFKNAGLEYAWVCWCRRSVRQRQAKLWRAL